MRVSDETRALLAEQHGLITRRQAAELGITRSALRWAVGHGWIYVLPGVMSAVGPQLSVGQRLLAALLYAGPESMIGSTTAAAWHGVTAAVDHRVVVLATARRSAGLSRTPRAAPGPLPKPICSGSPVAASCFRQSG
jgi:predicted transcriptional regulator of viral defense system